MRTPSLWLLVLVAGACKGEPFRPDAKIDADIDAFDPPWWTPKPGEAANWDLQLADPIDITAARAMYDVDLWQVTPAKTITYSTGAPVDVPAGPHMGLIDMIHAQSPRPIVICYLRFGTVNIKTDPDRTKFPGFEATPPNDPTPPKAGSSIGWSTGLPSADERWLDLRASTRTGWAEVLEKRIQLAKDIGCDGVDADRAIPGSTGFPDPPLADVRSFSTSIAELLHARELSAGTRANQAGLPDELDTVYDWIVLDRCAELQECDSGRPFTNLDKAVLAVDYDNLTVACTEWPKAMIRDGIFKRDPPAGNFRMVCP